MEVLLDNGYHTGHTAKGWAPGSPGVVDGKPRELTGRMGLTTLGGKDFVSY